MLVYAVEHDKTFFSKDFSQIFCSFSYIDDTSIDDNTQEYFGIFACDVDWDGYFKDPILTRYQQAPTGESWLQFLDPDPVILNDIFYNKLCDYLTLAKNKSGKAIIIDDEIDDIDDIDDINEFGTDKTDIYDEKEEQAIFDTMFNSVTFIEAFKAELNNPAKYNLLSAIEYFQLKEQDITESLPSPLSFKNFMREVL